MPNNDDWQSLLNILQSAKNTAQLNELVCLFLTPNERKILKKRYQIVAMLIKGKDSQRQIAQTLGVSISKITAGSKELQQSPDGLLKYLNKYFK